MTAWRSRLKVSALLASLPFIAVAMATWVGACAFFHALASYAPHAATAIDYILTGRRA